jgi:isoamyl acetate esterase
VKQTIESIDFNALCSCASVVRHERDNNDISCAVDSSLYQSGWFNVVFEIEFEDGVVWIARIQLPPLRSTVTPSKDDETTRQAILKSEIDTMRYVRSHSSITVPEVFDFNVSRSPEDNNVGYPYILMEALAGRTLDSQIEDTVPEKYREKVFDGIAECLVQLSSLRFSQIGCIEAVEQSGGPVEYRIKSCYNPAGCIWPQNSGPFSTAIDYFFTTRTIDYQETLKRHREDLDECFAAWLRLETAFAIVQLKFNNGPFPLYHPDFRLSNILFDEEYNITGVIDWSYAMTVPIEAFTNLQQDLLSSDSHLLLTHLRRHEAKLDSHTPLTNYLVDRGAAWRATVPLQCLTGVRAHRIEIAKELLHHLFGQDASWQAMRIRWLKSAFRRDLDPAAQIRSYVWIAASGVFLGAVLYYSRR